ncbi:MAG: hypothetical protein ABIW76_09945 [Fibrobacteria bacterium]
MSTNFRPKARIMFPNSWALNSFLLRLKRSSGWEYHAAANDTDIKVKPKGAKDYILIGLNKTGSSFEAVINAEKLGDKGDAIWKDIYDYARRYRC